MILKLRIQDDKRIITWRILDEIKQIDYKYMDEPKDLKSIKESEMVYINTNPNLPNKRIVEIWITYKKGTTDIMYTDDIFYIMNDMGKTCDTVLPLFDNEEIGL